MLRSTLITATALLALTALPPAPVAAQDGDEHPIVGIWSLNAEMSSYDPGSAPQGVRRRFGMDDEGYLVSVRITVAPSGNPSFAMARARLDGRDYPVWTDAAVYGQLAEGENAPGTASFEVVNERTFRLTQKNAAGEPNPVGPTTWAVSADGSTLTVTTQGTNGNGVDVHNVEVYQRVEN
jgi:hypothetical protein